MMEELIFDPVGEISTGNMHDKLLEIQKRIVDEEERIRLLKTLQRNGLSTRDIFAFTKKQAGLRVINKNIDASTAKVSMSAKIRDCHESLKASR